MTVTKHGTEAEHIEAIGRKKFDSVYLAALLLVRQDARLVGLDKLRGAIAHQAALRITGFPERPFRIPYNCGKAEQGTMDICLEIFARAVAGAATEVKP